MLRIILEIIERQVVFTLSGRMNADHISELKGRHQAQELSRLHPRMDHERTARKLALKENLGGCVESIADKLKE
jgi:hypothetical protein